MPAADQAFDAAFPAPRTLLRLFLVMEYSLAFWWRPFGLLYLLCQDHGYLHRLRPGLPARVSASDQLPRRRPVSAQYHSSDPGDVSLPADRYILARQGSDG